MNSYTKFLEEQLMFVFERINKSKNPEDNMKWFVSSEAREWYAGHKQTEAVVNDVVEIPTDAAIHQRMEAKLDTTRDSEWTDSVFKPNS